MHQLKQWKGMIVNMNILEQTDLSGKWDFIPENGEHTKIIVPGGGWLKQGFDCEAATYETRVSIPDILPDQSVFIKIGAVNHFAEYFIGEDEQSLQKIHEEVTAFTPQTVDLTAYVKPGQEYLLRINVRAWKDGRPIAPHWAEWSTYTARGIFGSAHILICPPVIIRDVFIKTKMDNTFSYEMVICNLSSITRKVKLHASFSADRDMKWEYPVLPSCEIEMITGESRVIYFGPYEWVPGTHSYWWPNQPYKDGYRANLHILILSLVDSQTSRSSSCKTRFGFRDIRQNGSFFELNGVRIKFRGDNLQVANYDGVDHNGYGDAIHTLPGFLPPNESCAGWPGAVDNFLRLNYNIQREHMGPWSPYMLDVCDEAGLMLIGESACRWNGFDMDEGRGFHEVKCLMDIIRRDRNHPSIIRWCTKNEAQCTDPEYHIELYNAVKSLDDTRPIYEDLLFADRSSYNPESAFGELMEKNDFTWIEHYLTTGADGKPYFTTIDHNECVVPIPGRPYGIGEANWMRSSTLAGLVWFATTIVIMRVKGASDIRPYVLLSSWASSIPGCRTTDFLTEENRHPVYGEDNLPNPFEHSGIKLLQLACNPILALDYDFWYMNRSSNAYGVFPVISPQIPCNSDVTRTITICNDDLAGEDLELNWELREGSLSNWVLEQRQTRLNIPVAGIKTIDITFRTPVFNSFVFLKFSVVKDGIIRFIDEHTVYETTGGLNFTSEFNGAERKFL